ncbi:MAG: glycosyltransferase [Rhodospirillales bacterium]|nr:glycosyltransferase [Rhodospirillales bacterium]
MEVTLVIPVFNDWQALQTLVRRLDSGLRTSPYDLRLIVVNDGSLHDVDAASWQSAPFERLKSLEIIDLVCNLGHQRAIAIGLCEAVDKNSDVIVVMDADGEDDPADVPALIRSLSEDRSQMALAQRVTRSEDPLFVVSYFLYKKLFRALTGFALSFGNFCALSLPAAKRLVFMPSLWNSLPASCLRSKLPYRLVPTRRGRRYDGESKMNFIGLVVHGLHAITVFSDAVLVRLAILIAALAGVSTVAVLMIRFFTDWVPLGWASDMLGFIGLALLVVVFGLLSTSLLTLQAGSSMPQVPYLHGKGFILGRRKILG